MANKRVHSPSTEPGSDLSASEQLEILCNKAFKFDPSCLKGNEIRGHVKVEEGDAVFPYELPEMGHITLEVQCMSQSKTERCLPWSSTSKFQFESVSSAETTVANILLGCQLGHLEVNHKGDTDLIEELQKQKKEIKKHAGKVMRFIVEKMSPSRTFNFNMRKFYSASVVDGHVLECNFTGCDVTQTCVEIHVEGFSKYEAIKSLNDYVKDVFKEHREEHDQKTTLAMIFRDSKKGGESGDGKSPPTKKAKGD